MTQGAHRRQNLLTGDWVLVSPHRLSRPWQGSVETVPAPVSLAHDADCYLCAGNLRASGQRNPDYAGVFVFDNDFPALLPASTPPDGDSLLISRPETGLCRVLCYSPDHSRSMSSLSLPEIEAVVGAWCDQSAELFDRPDIGAVTVFENRGEMMGASNPHPHGQIWATSSTPTELQREAETQTRWRARYGRPLLMDYLDRELRSGERIIRDCGHFVALTPYWAMWPFETLVLPRRDISDLTGLMPDERSSLARLLSDLTRIYDAVFSAPFPYTMGWHQRPADLAPDSGFIAHAHFYPPLLRSASVRKFMVGFEMLGMPQRDLTPEEAADRLREAARRIRV